MPRPSDLYANLGAPGMYQPTPWTPFVLPNVFLIPPVEDGRQVSCIFHSGSASPTAYDPFYGDPRCVQRNPSTPTVTNVTVLDQALSLIQLQVSAAGRRHVLSSRSSGSPSYSSDQSPFERAVAFPNVRFLIDNERHVDLQQDQVIPSRPASRRSSVFGERPYDHETFSEGASDEEEEGVEKTMKKFEGMTFKERAASALRSIGSAKIKRTENYRRSEEGIDEAVHRQNFLHFDQGSISSAGKKHNKRRTLGQLFGSNSSTNDTVLPTELPSGRSSLSTMSTNNPKLVKRKSISQLFGFAKSSTADVFEMQDAPARWEHASGLRPFSPPPKLSKRKSMTQLLGLGRRASSTTNLAAMDSTSDLGEDDPRIVETDPRLAALRALEGSPTSQPSRGLQSRNHSLRRSITAPSLAAVQQPPDIHNAPTSSSSSPKVLNRQTSRKSFLKGSAFSFLDPHRHFFHDHASVDQSNVQTPNSSPHSASSPPDQLPQDTTDSLFYNPVSTGSELEVEDVVPIFVPRLAVRSPTSPDFPPDGAGVVDLSSSIRLGGQKGDIAQWFDAHVPDGESEEEPSLELEMRLDSLSFDELSFDPESFARTAHA